MDIRSLKTLSILALLLAPPSAALAIEPCCNIVNIAATGLVTAREDATGRLLEFQVSDRRLLSTLTIGRAVHADFTTMQVSVQPDGGEPCCSIASVTGGVSPAPVAASRDVRKPAVQDITPCCGIVANAALRGRLGRVVVAYPEAVADTRMDVFRAGETTAIAGGYGNQALELLPGTYEVEISGKRVTGVTVRSGHDTQVKVGVLHVRAGARTRVDVVDGSGEAIAGAYGEKRFGLPIGAVSVQIAGRSEAVTIADGRVTEF